MKRYVAMSICGAVVVLAILGIGGVAEANTVVYVKNGNKADPVKVTKYSEFRRVVHIYPLSGAPKAMPKSKICAIVNDGERGYVRILNRCVFTPEQFAKIQKVREKAYRRSEAIKQAIKEAQDAEIRAKAEKERKRKAREAARKAREAAVKAEIEEGGFAAEVCRDADEKMQRALRLAKDKPAEQRDKILDAAKRALEISKRGVRVAKNKRTTDVRAANLAFYAARRSNEIAGEMVDLAKTKQADADEANETYQLAVYAQEKCRRANSRRGQ